MSFIAHFFSRFLQLRPGERGAFVVSSGFFFCVLASFYVLRPLRETFSVDQSDRLDRLFLYTFVAMLIASPVFSVLVSRLRRQVFVPLVYAFFLVNLLIFYGGLVSSPEFISKHFSPWHLQNYRALFAMGYFVWISVFNLFIVSVFWSVMADIYDPEQGERLFGPIAAGGTLGGIAGSLVTEHAVDMIGVPNLLWVSMLFLTGAITCYVVLERVRHGVRQAAELEPIRSSAGTAHSLELFDGAKEVVKSPYLMTLCCYMFLASLAATGLYFFQAELVKAQQWDKATRAAFFANINTQVLVITFLAQALLTSRLLRYLGVGPTLGLRPLLFGVGFLLLAIEPVIAVFVWVEVTQRSSRYGVGTPVKEYLFTLVSRQQKYKAKNFIDTVVYRGSDALAGAIVKRSASLPHGQFAFSLTPFAVAWLCVALALGIWQQRVLKERASALER